MDNYYVYRHIRPDTGQPFYIGVGQKDEGEKLFRKQYKRAFAKGKSAGRNAHWINIYKKADREVEILDEGLSRSDAFAKEVWFIALYGREDIGTGILCNWTDGGEGPTGTVWTDEQRQRASEMAKARPPQAKDVRKRARESMVKTVARTIRCVETGEVFRGGRLEVRDKMFPEIKSAFKNVSISCETGKPYKGYHFEFADGDKDMSFLRPESKRGSCRKNAVLNEKIVSEIKTLFNTGCSVKELSESYSLSNGLISSITRGLNWAWVLPRITRETKTLRRLTNQEVTRIKELLLEGNSTIEISKLMGLNQSTVQRIQSGQDHPNIGPKVPKGKKGKLSDESRNKILELHASGIGTRELADQFNVHITSIQRLVGGKSWKNAA